MSGWVNIQEGMPSKDYDIVKVKRADGTEERAYFHPDKMCWLNFYRIKTAYFQGIDLNWLHDATHWWGKTDD